MTRKQRKQQRKLKPQPAKFDEASISAMKAFARGMTRIPRDRSKDGQVFFKPKMGCNDYTGGIQLCDTCHYNFNNQFCHKMREALE